MLYGVYCYYFDIPLEHITCARYLPFKPFCQLVLVSFLSNFTNSRSCWSYLQYISCFTYLFFHEILLVHLYHKCKLYEPMRNSWCHDFCFPKYFAILHTYPFLPLYLISENLFGKIKFDELDFYFTSSLIFTSFVACKNQFWNWFLQAKNPVRRIWFFQLDFFKFM